MFAKRYEILDARLRVFCMTDDKEEKTLEGQEHFTEIAKSRDVEVLEGKSHFVEFGGNLVPVTKSGTYIQITQKNILISQKKIFCLLFIFGHHIISCLFTIFFR